MERTHTEALSQTLVVLHGFTQNGELLREHLQPIADRIRGVELVCLDAPHACSPESAERLFRGWGLERTTPPWLRWWDASDDGTVYHGLDETLATVRSALERYPRAGILGFSQGAILGAAVAGLSQRGELPQVGYAILVAGRVPRATALKSAFDSPIDVPSLHVWGAQDPFAVAKAPALIECFDPTSRETLVWDGPHVLPTRGVAADAIVGFVKRCAT